MFDQLTWAIGMFVQSAVIVVAIVYGLRNSRLVSGFIFQPDKLGGLSVFTRYAVPGLAIASFYLLAVVMLWWIYGREDDTAIDWAVIVLIVGVLLAGPIAGVIAAVVILPVRAMIVVRTVAEAQTLAAMDEAGWFGFNAVFWLEEAWVWRQPGVVQLVAGLLLSAVIYVLFIRVLRRPYLLWIGVPIALGVQSAFVTSAYFVWGSADAAIYLRTEALPAAIALAITIFIFLFVLLAIRSDHERQRSHAAALESARNELRFYNAQINPHFLNNALSAISAIVPSSPDRAVGLLGELGAYFRGLCTSMDTLVPLALELELVKSYLSLEKARLGDRLRVAYEIDEQCLATEIPRMSLQVLVENAIKHGVGALPEGGLVTIAAGFAGESLQLSVSDNGPGMMKALTPGDYGVGLTNVQTRLDRLYGDDASLSIGGRWGAGTDVTLTINRRALHRGGA